MVEVEDVALPTGGPGGALVRIFRPPEVVSALPVVLYLADRAGADDELARALAARSRTAVLVPEEELSRDLESSYLLLCWIAAQGARRRLDGSRIAIVGNGRAADLVRLAGARGGPALCPVEALSPPKP
jgi:hypothetical protein